MTSNKFITQKQLKEILEYNPDTGLFTWIRQTSSRVKIGSTAGCEVTFSYGGKYINIKALGRLYLAHRLAWFYVHGNWPKDQIDHINGHGTDNRIINLRDVTQYQNMRNMRLPSNNTSGHIGVSWITEKKKWTAQLHIKGKHIHLGYFDDINDAVIARKKAADEYGFSERHGEKMLVSLLRKRAN